MVQTAPIPLRGGTGSPVNPYLTIQHALDQVGTNGTVSVAAGTYDETIAISKSGITLTGAGAGSVIMGQAVSGATVSGS